MESLVDEHQTEEQPDSSVRIFGKLYSTFPSIIDIFDDEVYLLQNPIDSKKLEWFQNDKQYLSSFSKKRATCQI